MDLYAQIASKIIKQQESIIGPVAIEQAQAIGGLELNWGKELVTITGNGQQVVDRLVRQYKNLFGQISVEVCKEAASALLGQLPQDKLPETLK